MAIPIKVTERSYGGKRFRPNTIVDFEESNNLLICITPWGQVDVAQKVSDSIKSFITMANEDNEVTVPFARKETLHQMGNVLRMAIIMASEKVYNEYNKEEYTAGFEIFAAIQEGPQWIFVSCGQPSLVISRKGMGILPLHQSIDLNVLSLRTSINDPLPNQLLGLGQHPPIHFGNLRLKKSDKIALISRTYLPNEFFNLRADEFNLDQLSLVLAKENQEVPFWIGFLDVA